MRKWAANGLKPIYEEEEDFFLCFDFLLEEELLPPCVRGGQTSGPSLPLLNS